MQDDTTIDAGIGKVRVDLDCLIGIGEAKSDRSIQVDECLIKLSFASPQDCPVMEYEGIVWINADRLVVVGERALEGACFIQGITANIVSRCVSRIEPDRLVEFGDCPWEIATAVGGNSPLSVEFGVVR